MEKIKEIEKEERGILEHKAFRTVRDSLIGRRSVGKRS